jgi:hypothetical protein
MVQLAVAVMLTMLLAACASSAAAVPTVVVSDLSTLWPTSTPQPTVVDRGLAYGFPCIPPCWEGLIPGVTTRNQTEEILQGLQQDGAVLTFGCVESVCAVVIGPGMEVEVWIAEGVVHHIKGRVNFSFDAGQLVDLIGEPTAVYPAPRDGVCIPCDQEPNPREGDFYLVTHLLYPDLGARFLLGTGIPGCVCPNTVVMYFEYFSPMSMGETLEYLHRSGQLSGVQESDLGEWQGFAD